jgi:hypothetical protein
MSKVKANLIKVNLKAGNKEQAVYLALQNNVQRSSVQANGDVNGNVILDEAYCDVKHVLNKHEWAGYLSALEGKGLYKRYDEAGQWGIVVSKAAE